MAADNRDLLDLQRQVAILENKVEASVPILQAINQKMDDLHVLPAMVERHEKVLYGNGQMGLLQQFAILQTEVKNIKDTVETVPMNRQRITTLEGKVTTLQEAVDELEASERELSLTVAKWSAVWGLIGAAAGIGLSFALTKAFGA